ncbi:MAG: 2-dehydropantoate 2-reductase [Parahaliea sp.]
MPWHVLGTGAMGSLMAARLAKVGCEVILLPRVSCTSNTPITLSIQDKQACWQQSLAWEDSGAHSPIKQLLVLTKAVDVSRAILNIAHRLSPQTEVVLLSNGMGFADELKSRLPYLNPVFGTTTDGAYRKDGWHIIHAGNGSTHLGRAGQTVAPAWFEPWRKGLGNCQWTPTIDTLLWRKLAINCVINPLTAIHRCHNGQLIDRPALAMQVHLLCQELSGIYQSLGQHEAARELEQQVLCVIRATANNRSSMLQDITAGRPTEIDYITGFVVAQAQAKNLAAPLNEALLTKVKALHRLSPV